MPPRLKRLFRLPPCLAGQLVRDREADLRAIRHRPVGLRDRAVQLERVPLAVMVGDVAVGEFLDPRGARHVVEELARGRAESVRALDLLLLVGEMPLRMRSPLVELRLEVDWDVGVQLQRGHLSFELIARAIGRDAREQLIGRSGCERPVRKRVDRVCDVVHEDRHGVRVVDQIGDIPLPQVQVEQKLRRRSPRSMRRGRDRRDEVEVTPVGSRHGVERDRQRRGDDKVLSRRDCGVQLEDRADAELHSVERRNRKRDVQLAVGTEIERLRKSPERRHPRAGNDRASRHRGGQRRVRISWRQTVERVVEDLLTHGETPSRAIR